MRVRRGRGGRPISPRGATPRPLAGVPIVVKDNIATLTMPTSCGSRILEGYVSPYEATAITRLRDAGAVVAISVVWLAAFLTRFERPARLCL